jgi:hypothetical protein
MKMHVYYLDYWLNQTIGARMSVHNNAGISKSFKLISQSIHSAIEMKKSVVAVVFSMFLLFSLFSIMPVHAADSNWTTTRITVNVGAGSLAVDSTGNPHVCFTDSEGLKYASLNGQNWNIQTVDKNSVLFGDCSIALDASGNPHLAYSNYTALKYAVWNGSAWNTQFVEDGSINGMSLVLDSQGNPHVCYVVNELDLSTPPNVEPAQYNILKYASWTGSEWSKQTIDQTTQAYYLNSLSLDTAQNPRIAYQYYSNNTFTLGIAKLASSTWSIQKVNITDFASVAFDSKGNPHILYCVPSVYSFSNYVLNYSSWDGSRWGKQNFPYNGTSGSIVLDSHGNPQVAYFQENKTGPFYPNLMYASWDGSKWSSQTVTSLYYTSGPAVLVLDSHENRHILFFEQVYAGSASYVENLMYAYSPAETDEVAFNPTIIYFVAIAAVAIGVFLVLAVFILRRKRHPEKPTADLTVR